MAASSPVLLMQEKAAKKASNSGTPTAVSAVPPGYDQQHVEAQEGHDFVDDRHRDRAVVDAYRQDRIGAYAPAQLVTQVFGEQQQAVDLGAAAGRSGTRR